MAMPASTDGRPPNERSPRRQVLRFALDAVAAETFNDASTLFLFGTYTIGKERLFLEVAAALGKKVYVSASKRKVPCSAAHKPLKPKP